MIDAYDWPGGREAVLRFGPDEAPLVVAALPLFEEANRTRTFAVRLLRCLAKHGIAGALPDLPAIGESSIATEQLSLPDLRSAFTAAVTHLRGDRAVFSLAIRSGALLDTDAALHGRWRLSPVEGPELVRELKRIGRSAGDAEAGTGDAEIAGNTVTARFLDELGGASWHVADAASCVVRLSTDPAPADRQVTAAPLWRRSEPGDDPALAETLAADIAGWIAACAG